MKFILLLFIIVLGAKSALSACGLCGKKSGVVCRDRTTFSFCKDNNVDPIRYNCPSGTYCGDDYRICASDPVKVCNPVCGNCTGRFTCLSQNTYALCFGLGYPTGPIFTCPDNQLCSTQKASDGLSFCFDKISLRNEEIDCYKDIVIKMRGGDGSSLLPPAFGGIPSMLLPPANPNGIL